MRRRTSIAFTAIALIVLMTAGCAFVFFGDAMEGAGKPAELRAYFNGEEATVTNATIRVGQPCLLELHFTAMTHMDYLLLRVYEPGSMQAYDMLEGEMGIEIHDIGAGSTLYFNWTVVPGGNWTGGTAPVQLFYSFCPAPCTDGRDSAISGSFSFANPMIVE